MDVNQARELYSGYYDGTLERVSVVALDQAIEASVEIREDYASFAAVMDALPRLAEQKVELPHDLHDRILAKLDHHDWEQKQSKRFSLFSNPKMAWFGAAAACLIVVAGFAVLRPSSGPANTAGGVGSSKIEVSFTYEGGYVNLVTSSNRAGTVKIRSLDGAANEQTFDLRSGDLNRPLSNTGDQPLALVVEATGSSESDILVLPGKLRTPRLNGDGTYIACARAMASTFGTPVQVVGDAERPCRWSFTQRDTAETLVVTLARSGIRAAVLGSGILRITAK